LVSQVILSFVCPFPVLVHHELLVRSFNRWWQEAIISRTLSNVEAFPSNRDQWFFWRYYIHSMDRVDWLKGCSDVVVPLSYKVIL